METAGLTEDIYGLMDVAKQYNQMLNDYYFEAEWQEGAFLKENGEINYDSIDDYLSENSNVSSDVVEKCKENQLFLNELGNGNLNGIDGKIDNAKVDDYIAEHPLVTDVDTIIENYEVQVANTNFLNNFETLFMYEEGNINENKLNQYLEDNPRVSIDIAEQVVNTVKDNNLFQKEMEEGNFFDLDGNVDLSLVDEFIAEHPYTTLNTEEIFNEYEENYANLKLWEEYEKGTFKDSIGNWNEEAYLNYVKEHPNATNGEDVKKWHLNEYPDLSFEEVQQQTTQTVTVSFACGVVDIFETVVDGGAYLLGTVGDALGIDGSKETMGQFIQNDYSGELYDSWTGALGVRSEIAYGNAHTVGTVAGKIVGTVLFSAIPGGCAVSTVVGALSAAGSAAETAFQSGADVDSAFKVAGGAFVLGAISGYGIDKVANSVEFGTLSLKQGLGAATLVSAVEPIGNSIIEYNSYGNKLVDSEGNVLYDNYLDYYVESGALLNTGIAVAGSVIRVGSSYLKGEVARKTIVEDNVKQALPEGKEKVQVIDQDVDGEVTITEYDADDLMFKSGTNMDDYVDVDNMTDYPSNKTLGLDSGTDSTLEVLDDATDAVDDASNGLTKVADATDNGISKIQDIDNVELIGDKYSAIEGLEPVEQLDGKLLDVVDNLSDTVDETSIGLTKSQFSLDDLGTTKDDVEQVLNSMDDDTFNNLVSKLVKSEKIGLIKDDELLNKVVGTYIFYQNGGSIDTSEFVEILKRLSTEQAITLSKSFSPKMSVFASMTKDLGVELNTDLIVECYKSPNDAIKKLLVNMENMTSIEKSNFYVKYINYFSGEGVSISDFYKLFGSSDIVKFQFNTDKIEGLKEMKNYFGDIPDSCVQVHSLLKSGYTPNEVLSTLNGQAKLDFLDYMNNTREGRFLSSLTSAEMKALTIYTDNNYFTPINEALRNAEGDLSKITGTLPNTNISIRETIENIEAALKKYGGVDEDMVLYRGINRSIFSKHSPYSYLFNGISSYEEFFQTLKTLEGETLIDYGFMSTSPCYGCSFTWKDITLEISVPKGTPGAYINQISNYYNTENEFLLSLGTKLKIDNVCKKSLNGVERLVVECSIE